MVFSGIVDSLVSSMTILRLVLWADIGASQDRSKIALEAALR
jgi:hypothetical protein